jgi:hypothetical protein
MLLSSQNAVGLFILVHPFLRVLLAFCTHVTCLTLGVQVHQKADIGLIPRDLVRIRK